MERETKTKGFKAYIKLNIPYNWEKILKKHKLYIKFVDLVYTSAKNKALGYSSAEKRYRVMGECVRTMLHNDIYIQSFFRDNCTKLMNTIIDEFNTITYNEK